MVEGGEAMRRSRVTVVHVVPQEEEVQQPQPQPTAPQPPQQHSSRAAPPDDFRQGPALVRRSLESVGALQQQHQQQEQQLALLPSSSSTTGVYFRRPPDFDDSFSFDNGSALFGAEEEDDVFLVHLESSTSATTAPTQNIAPPSSPSLLNSLSQHQHHHHRHHPYQYYSCVRPDTTTQSPTPVVQQQKQQQQQQQQHFIMEDERKEEERRETIRRANASTSRQHEWDADADFPIQEIQRIKNKTKKLRGAGQKQQQQQQQQDDNEAFFVDHPVDFPPTTTTTTSSTAAAGKSARRSQDRRRFWSNSHGSSDDGSRNQLSQQQQQQQQQQAQRPGGAASNDGTTVGTNTDAETPCSSSSNEQPPTSRAAAKAHKQLLQDFRRPRALSSDGASTSIPSGSEDAVESRLAQQEQKKPKQQLESSINTTHNTTTSTSDSYDDSNDPNLGLHDLCGEAVTTDDIAWRNALHLLSLEPQLAAVVDSQGWTPLHISCLGAAPPPPFMLRALLYVHPRAAQLPDDGGRLPLHLVAASSADVATLQVLVQEHPAAVSVRDEHGLTPLHLLLRNRAVPLQLRAVQVALGLTVSEKMDDGEYNKRRRRRNSCYNRRKQSRSRSRSRSRGRTPTKSSDDDEDEVDNPHHPSNHILQRRRQHLNMTLEQLEDWRLRQHATVTTNLLNHNELAHERHFATYPHDVQVALRQLAHWKHRQRQQEQEIQEETETGEVGIEVQLPATSPTTPEDSENGNHNNNNNPAAIPFPGKSRQLPIHMLVQRGFLDAPTVLTESHDREREDDDDDDDDESTTKKSTAGSEKHSSAKIQEEVPSNSRDEEQDKEHDEDGDDEWNGDSSEDDDEEILSILDRYRNSMRKKKKKKAKSKSKHHKPSPASVPHAISVLRLLAAVYPEGLTVRDGHGRTPLLQVLTHEQAPLPDAELVEILLGTHLQFIHGDDEARLPAWAADLPLHLLLQSNGKNNNDSGSSKHHRFTNAAMLAIPDTGQLPLHVAAEELASDAAVVSAIRQAYPGAVSVVDHRGRTPLHLALRNYRRVPMDPRVVELLFSDRVAHIRDDYGQLPLDLLVEQQRHHHQLLLPRSKMPNEENDGTGGTAFTTNSIYQRLVRASILGAARPATPSQRSTLLRRLRRLPAWLRRDACATTVVQDLLVEDVLAYPWQCAYILWDGALLVALITVFRQQLKQFVDQLESAELLSTWYTYAVYATATLRLCGLLVQGGLAVSLGDFGHLCGGNLRYWLDFWAMLFSIVTSAFLYSAASDERLLGLGTASSCLLWASLIGYLSNWWHGMAVFTGGFTKIAYRMVSPLICAAILVVASAQCFFTLLQLECVDAMGIAPVCSVRDAYRIVFMLLRGDPFIDPTGVADLSTAAILMVATVLAVFVMFLLALLVTILISAARLDFADIALGSYWEPKLAFVLYSEDLGLSRPAAAATQTDESHHYSFAAKQARAWDFYMQTLFGGQPEKGSNWFARPMQSTVLTWITAIFVVPIWFVLGLATLGLLWPPQLRQWLFRPAWRQMENSRSNRCAADQSTPQIVAIRDELMQLKMMSYEKSNGIENELRELKELLRSAVQE